MKTETDIRQMIAIVEAFRCQESAGNVLRWVLDEYPPPRGPFREISEPTEEQDPGLFVHFKLKDGGRVHIPLDQIKRMWNEEQRRKPPEAKA